MARLEGRGGMGAVCAKSLPDWDEVCEKKKKVLSKARSLTKIRYEMTRESPTRHLADKEGVIRPFIFLASMSSHHRAMLAIQLGWCPFAEEAFGDPHEEAWAIINKKGLGLRARCVRGIQKVNPFATPLDWVGILNHVAQTLYVPSYMAWQDEFSCEKMSKPEGKDESQHIHSRKVYLM